MYILTHRMRSEHLVARRIGRKSKIRNEVEYAASSRSRGIQNSIYLSLRIDVTPVMGVVITLFAHNSKCSWECYCIDVFIVVCIEIFLRKFWS